jgi:AraC-like DNA-binding protein
MFRATKIRRYLKAMQQRGVSAVQLLAGAQIDSERLLDSDYLISESQYQTVVANMMRLTGDPGIAFTLYDNIDFAELGIVGYAMLSANSLSQATHVWLDFSNSFIGTPTNIQSFKPVAPGYELAVSSISGFGPLHQFETEELLVRGMVLVRKLMNAEPVLGKVSLSYPAPSHRALYDQFCKCPVEFDARQTVFRVLSPEMDAKIQTRDDELFQICAQHCQQILRSIPEAGQLRNQIRNMFLSSPGNLPDMNTASSLLGMSASTLRRQLDASGQSWQTIKDEFRFDLAREYLLSGHMMPKQVGYLLGFTSPSVFSRAFKVWSGQTVGQFLTSNNR